MSDQDHAKLHLFKQHGSAEEESGCWTCPAAVQSFYTNNRTKQSQRDCSAHRPPQTQETWTCQTLPNKFFTDSRRAQILLKRWNDFLSLMVFCSFVNKIGVYEGWVALSDTWTTHMWIFAQTAICVLGPFGSRQSTWKPSVTLQNVEKNSQVNESPAANLQKLWKLFRKPPAVGTYQVKVLTLIKPWAFSQSKRCLLTCSTEMTTKTMATVYRFLGNQSSNAAMQPLV